MLTKNLIPLYLYQGHPVPRPTRLYDYLLTAGGVVKRLETPYVSADQLLVSIDTPLTGLHLAAYPLQPLCFKPPRIPGRLLREVLADARQNIDLEFMYHFRLNADGQCWTVIRPEQDQSRTRVGYRYDPTGIVVDCHSHNRMDAFFSQTDDRDEQGGRIYSVMGHLERDNPELILRLGFYGTWLNNIPALTIFDDITPFVEIQPDMGLPIWDSASERQHQRNSGWLTNLFSWRGQ